jgi:hypothetical protein
MGRFDWQREEARKKYPRETVELLRRLDGWRAALRKELLRE